MVRKILFLKISPSFLLKTNFCESGDDLYYLTNDNTLFKKDKNNDTSNSSNLCSVKFNKDKGIFYTLATNTDPNILTDYNLRYKAYDKDSIKIDENTFNIFAAKEKTARSIIDKKFNASDLGNEINCTGIAD